MKKLILLMFAPLVLSGCFGSSSVDEVDVSQATCETIEEFRVSVGEEFRAKMEEISDTYWVARRSFQDRLNECMYDAWEGNSCDAEWEARTQAYEAAMNDISNEAAYQTYKAALDAWNECSADFDAAYERYAEEARAKEVACEAEFQASLQNANEVRDRLESEASTKRQSDLAALDALEEKCKKEEEERLEQLVQDANDAVILQRDRVRGGTRRYVYRPSSVECTGVIPGESSTPRTGRPDDTTVAEEVAEELLQQLADEVSRTPIPTDAIDNRIFAGMVCAKLTTRLNELIIEQSDAPRRRAIELREVINRYSRAKDVWCRIAAGYTTGNQLQQTGGVEPGPECSSSADCGDSVCCSATEIGRWVCTEDGDCMTEQEACPENHTCSGRPASCIPDPITVECIFYNGHLIPVDQVRIGKGSECDGVEHWHADTPPTALDGTRVPDPAPLDCGYGKVGEVPVVEALIPNPEYRIEVRMGF